MKKLLFLLYIISQIICDETLESLNLIIQSGTNQSYISACEGIKPTSARDCVVGTVEWDYRCCYVYYKNKKVKFDEHCQYLEDKASSIKTYAQTLKKTYNENYKINCNGNFLKFYIHLIIFILLL